MRFLGAGLCGAGLLVVAGSLAAQDVKTDHDKQYDFSKLRTYTIEIATSWNNQLSERRVVASLDSVLRAKGWTPAADSAQPDAAVVLHGAVGQKVDLQTYYTATPVYARARWGAPAVVATTEAYQYLAGSLVVDIFELSSRNLVFRGSATDQLSDKPEKNQKKLANAWKKMFKDFPPKPGK